MKGGALVVARGDDSFDRVLLLGESFDELASKLVYLAWRRFRIPSQDARDVVQITFAAYLVVEHRYRGEAKQRAIFLGIFRNKCLEHIDRSVRDRSGLRAFAESPDAGRENLRIDPEGRGAEPSTLDQLVKREEGQIILHEFARLNGKGDLLWRIADGESLKSLIAELGIPEDTVHARLHAARMKLRAALAKKDVHI